MEALYMKLLLIIFLISLFILLIPIKLTLSFSYIDSTLSFKIYNFKILPKDKGIKSKKQKTKFNFSKNKLKKLNNFINDNISPSFVKLLFYKLKHRSYKPKLIFDTTFNYSLSDPKNTAVAYGFISALFPILYNIISVVFKIKDSKFKVNPVFKDKLLINFKSKCIIKISIGQIIYTILIIIKEVYTIRRCSH
ncbi:DUF2953 domain-containing protein [Clostridium thermobutyricum]|uniref:DUF2953 domain-containing protein n=1 Tax=Clostridium thermobutyricum TaxID=29372 RepID=UPI00374DAEFF